MPLEVSYILNILRSSRPRISPKAIKYILKIVLQNSTTRSFSYTIITKEVKKRGHEVIPRTV
jgi:hypothetical protein